MCEHFKLIMVQLQFIVPFSVIVTAKTAISVLLLVTVRKHPTVLSAIKTFLLWWIVSEVIMQWSLIDISFQNKY